MTMHTKRTPARVLASAALALSLGASGALAQTACPTPPGGVRQPDQTIRYLADDALEGRRAGSHGARCAGDYIARQFEELGLEPGGDDGTYFQELPLASSMNPHAPAGTGRNVIGILRGSDPALQDEAIVIGAHYDHLGMGGMGSLAPDTVAVHNGADDNASGVGALVVAARALLDGPRPARSIVFVAFTGEESGLLGSAYYATHPTIPLDHTRGMINMDMVGRLGEIGPMIVYGTGTAEEWPAIIERHAADAGIQIAEQPEGYGPSDQTSFYAHDVPVLHFFTNTHTDYHKPSDDWQKINMDGVARVGRLAAAVARDIADLRPTLTLVRGAGKPPGEQAAATETRGYGAYLGSIPDFTPVDFGVRLSGVRADSPADLAGLKSGDIIIHFGDMEIADLYDLTDALRAHKPGDTLPVTVRRDGDEITVNVTLASRGDDS